MTNIEQIQIDYTDGAPLAPEDPRGAMARAVQAARAVVGHVNASNADRPTPCGEWTVHQVAQHLVAVFDRAAACPTDADLNAMPILTEVAVGDLEAATMNSVQQLHANWTDDATLSMMIDVPWGTFPGAAVIGAYASETLVHTWDLAAGMGLELNWPETDLAVHVEMVKMGIAEEGRDNEFIPFGAVVRPAADDAPAIEHLAGWMGHDVNAWQS